MKQGNVSETVAQALAPVAAEMGMQLWDVLYHKVGADWILDITLDKEEGVTIDDCERFHRAIDPLLDELDPIEDAYILQVSSPGIERDIRTEAHIGACMGEEVEARLFAPLAGKRCYIGVLEAYQDGVLTLRTEPEEAVQIPRASISRMHTTYHP